MHRWGKTDATNGRALGGMYAQARRLEMKNLLQYTKFTFSTRTRAMIESRHSQVASLDCEDVDS